MDSKLKQRIALSTFFFLSGFSFSSWAARIPTIKTAFGFNEAELGTILLAMPISSLIGLPFSGWLITKFDSRIPLSVGFLVHATCLSLISFANTTLTLVLAIFLFAFSMRILNIAMNTQAITLQKQFDRKINGSFHGLWSTGGIAGVGFTTLLVALDISIVPHLIAVSVVAILITLFTYRFLLRDDRSTAGNKLAFGKPDPYILYLGLLVFFAAICEGGMFDWSGIYFQEVVQVEIFTSGYLIFMAFMALSRFLSDRIIERIGMPATYVLSAVFIFSGIGLAILMPNFWPAMLGFSLVGFGTAAVIPMTFTLAGASKKYSPGMAISIIATYGMVGMLIGPPLIGYLAHAFNLRVSFIAFACAGLMFIPISTLFFKNEAQAATAS
ncbi:MFS transporter [Pontibacter ummariensis]|uniref:Sugar phosphate permease n=1 Tax=Pontibacter ummariensis TaxID=1610492 RepID=A0A239EUB9_9BACT|nr:MFS transporter [Pontibacter ummariensis]SNS47633.1 Sugar phosphate permease [Pontibacter ummariensis]